MYNLVINIKIITIGDFFYMLGARMIICWPKCWNDYL